MEAARDRRKYFFDCSDRINFCADIMRRNFPPPKLCNLRPQWGPRSRPPAGANPISVRIVVTLLVTPLRNKRGMSAFDPSGHQKELEKNPAQCCAPRMLQFNRLQCLFDVPTWIDRFKTDNCRRPGEWGAQRRLRKAYCSNLIIILNRSDRRKQNSSH